MMRGRTAAEIAASVRDLVDSGALASHAELPTVRALAEDLGVNRNTVAAAYALLVQAGVAETAGRRGTRIAGIPEVPHELAPPTFRRREAENGSGPARRGGPRERAEALVDLVSGNPDPVLLPDLRTALAAGGYGPVLYGAAPVDPGLLGWAREELSPVLPPVHGFVVTHGAVDAIERVLAAHLTRGDAVAVEDPCFLASIGVLKVQGYRVVPVAVDGRGMTPSSLAAALRSGARAVVCTPRAHNPTGASVPAERAAELGAVLAEHPHVLVVEDDHFSGVATTGYHRITPPQCPRWAVVRSVSKFLGPDLRLAVVAADPDTVRRLETRLAAGATWVSRLLQSIAHGLLTDPAVQTRLAEVAATYRQRRHFLLDALRDRGFNVATNETDGLNVWVPLDRPAGPVIAHLAACGWSVSDGATYALTAAVPPAVRVTVATMTADRAGAFADSLAEACPTGDPTHELERHHPTPPERTR